jgi:hypothetical protein
VSEPGLIPLHGLAGTPTVIVPAAGELILGREPGGSGVKVQDPLCSRRHALLRRSDAAVRLRDLESKNGTYVNNRRIVEATLAAGDIVRIGHAEFAFAAAGEAFRCASCMKTLVCAPPEAPFCTECRRTFPLLGATLGQRRLIRGLGQGSFGTVYVAHRRGNPYVAMKVLHVEFTESPEIVMKFLKEAYATSGIEHENIVRFGDAGHEAGHWFIILEYFPSTSLKEILEEHGHLPEADVLAIARQVISAMVYAHERKLLHRDLKPGNILVGEGGKVRLVDFGLAKRLVDCAFTSHTTSGMPGTPMFMAPEVLTSEGRANFAADIYSLAATLYRALTGRHPIEAKKLEEWLHAIQTQVPPRARSIRPEISQRVDDALAKGLEKDPNKRHATMADFARALGVADTVSDTKRRG